MKSALKSKYTFYILFALILLTGLWLRLRNIDQRPMHGDEANQAYRFQMLFEDNNFKYEPKDFHGPTLYYLTLPSAWFSGLSDFKESSKAHFRAVPVIFSLLTALGTLLFIDVLGRRGVLVMSLLIMLSPAMVYYSSYYIQETLLVCFTLFFIGGLWRYWRKPSMLWALVAGVSLGLMHATKETFVLTMGALALSLAFICYKQRKVDFSKFKNRNGIAALFAALTVSVMFYSSFLSNPKGPVDSVTAFIHSVKRGLGANDFEERFTSGEGHSKPFNYYLSTIAGSYPRKFTSTLKDIYRNSAARPISEIFLLLFPVIGLLNLPKKGSRSRKIFMMALVYTVSLTVVYSLIPYKTPWCMLSFLLGFMFCCAMSFRFMSQKLSCKFNKIFALGAVLMIFDLGRQSSIVTAEEFCVSDRNPYAYVQPYFDVEDLSKRITEISEIEGSSYDMPIHFLTPDYWPLPWYLKKFKNVGYWEKSVPEIDPQNFPVIVTTPDREELSKKLEKTHVSEYRGRMPGYHLLVFYRKDLWEKYNDRP
ncbi:MAG: TIGR03663 family protein [Lentisphaeraceae bacterium]|nr:TIGR03663 family protein [Lentisphaeraceae bacterium]